jgi:uncharacterized membrane protein
MSLLTLTDAVTPQLIVHISAGSLAILSGTAALSVRKGARLHRVFGTIFFLSIIAMSVMGAYLAVLIPQRATAVVGLFTFYFVATAWMTVKRREGTTGAFEIAACAFAFAAATVLLVWGIMATRSPTGELDDIPPTPYWIAASFAAFVAVLDLKVLLQRGIAGAHRIARHLWRMCFALFFASSNFFLGQQKVMPASIRGSKFFYLPEIIVLGLMIFWLLRVLFTKAYKKGSILKNVEVIPISP